MRRSTGTAIALVAVTAVAGCAPTPWTSTLVSTNAAGSDAGNGTSHIGFTHVLDNPLRVFSADGEQLAFTSEASDLVAGDTNGNGDVFVRDLGSGDLTLVSLEATETNGANGFSFEPFFSPDGTKVAFSTYGSDLGATDTNNGGLCRTGPAPGWPGGRPRPCADIYVRDLVTGVTTPVSADTSGTATGNHESFNAGFTPDSSSLLFASLASNLVAGDTNGQSDVFVRDLAAGTTSLLSTNAAGVPANGSSGGASLSADGTKLLFVSSATDLAANDTNARRDVFVKDLATGTTTLVSVNAAGTGTGNGESAFDGKPSFSADGTKVAFNSLASDLTAEADGHSGPNVFVRDLAARTTSLVSVNTAGTSGGNGWSTRPVFSPDGNLVAFASGATDLVATSDPNGLYHDVFVRDLAAGTTTLVSVNGDGNATGNAESLNPVFSPDGGRLAFISKAGNLGSTDNNGATDIYFRHLADGTTTLVTAKADKSDSSNAGVVDWNPPVFSPDGNHIAFAGTSSNFGPTDTNAQYDVYLASPPPPT